MKTCENCGEHHSGTYGSGRFCSTKCSRGFSTKVKRAEINQKVSLTLTKAEKIELCKYCKNEFVVKRSRECCSVKCAAKYKMQKPEYVNQFSKNNSIIAKKRHDSGDKSFGWKTRKKLQPSYPETIAINTLKSLGIEYEYEMPLEKYFVDFAIHDRMIVIEIDGQQHKLKERIETDIKKDALLNSLGWTVYRIKWPEDNIIESVTNILRSKPSA